ncbi:MAG: S41 family peptidase [Hyphomonadaceae bacterium]
MRADGSAAERLARADAATGGEGAVSLEWRDTAAILAVNTMSGADTITRIDAAFDEIVARTGTKLIIDLRRNTGGAFAVRTLIGHLIRTPLDAGVFVSRLWYAGHDAEPLPSDWTSAAPWTGYSVREFLPFMLARPLTAHRIEPLRPHFAGRVYVLTSARSLSAAEIAADAMRAGCGATIIGEQTPGAVLSSKRFDIAGGFHLIVPVADYYSISSGRLEGAGVAPDISVAAEQALEIALAS